MNPIRFVRDLTMGLITSKDGSYSLTKLAATTFHFQLAIWLAWHTYTKGFDMEAWILYGTFAVGHAGYDKTMAVVNSFKTRKMEKENADPAQSGS